MGSKQFKLSLAIVSGLLLGFSFPPVPIGVFALFAFVPFFILFESIESHKEAFRYSYLTFFVFNIVTLYWTGGFVHGKDVYMMIAGASLLLVHPFFFYVPIAGWMFFRRQLGFKPSIFIFPFLWVGFEYLHSLSEIGFPWLTIGNTQTYDLAIIQFTTFTGVYGLSFWILSFNIAVFILYSKLALRE
ncbi:MAG TPA: apolipoprotein N-acyltransferase, partial [Bacteroidota bacterium]|nr:apolipoprotein N-acyltransferase [Bacteroidota bacterium]